MAIWLPLNIWQYRDKYGILLYGINWGVYLYLITAAFDLFLKKLVKLQLHHTTAVFFSNRDETKEKINHKKRLIIQLREKSDCVPHNILKREAEFQNTSGGRC